MVMKRRYLCAASSLAPPSCCSRHNLSCSTRPAVGPPTSSSTRDSAQMCQAVSQSFAHQIVCLFAHSFICSFNHRSTHVYLCWSGLRVSQVHTNGASCVQASLSWATAHWLYECNYTRQCRAVSELLIATRA